MLMRLQSCLGIAPLLYVLLQSTSMVAAPEDRDPQRVFTEENCTTSDFGPLAFL